MTAPTEEGNMDRKQELEQQIRALSQELHAIQDTEADKENAALLGKCFRTRNNYSCPETEDDYWWLYLRVTGVKDGHLIVLRFENDKKGRLTIEEEPYYSRRTLDSYEQITEDEFYAAWHAQLGAAAGMRTRPEV